MGLETAFVEFAGVLSGLVHTSMNSDEPTFERLTDIDPFGENLSSCHPFSVVTPRRSTSTEKSPVICGI